MGSLENGFPLKRLRSLPSPATGRRTRPLRSSLVRLPVKINCLPLVLAVASFSLLLLLFQVFLPGSAVEKPDEASSLERGSAGALLGDIDGLEFGYGIKFASGKLLQKLWKENQEAYHSAMAFGRPVRRFQLQKPRLAVVVPDLLPNGMQLKMVSVAAVLKECGFDIQVFSFDDGPVRIVWRSMEISVTILPVVGKSETTVDWLEYNGILVNSIEARPVFSCLLQEPFKSVPVIWTIQETSLAFGPSEYSTNRQLQLTDEWKKVFSRATVVVFPTHSMLMMYSTFNMGNYMVIPGSPAEAWEADTFMAIYKDQTLRESMGYTAEDFLIAIVGSQFSYSGMLLEHGLFLEALRPLVQQISNVSHSSLKVCILGWNFTGAYKKALEVIAQKVGYPSILVEHFASNDDASRYLGTADLVIYGSFFEEQFFPSVLTQAMSMGKLIVAPDLEMIRKYLDRNDSPHRTWEEVYKNVKKVERASKKLHERDDRELERTGQPLCIYEPYFGEGTWPFLHQTWLYRGISLSSEGRRSETDDIDASSYLSVLSNPYYRDALGEYGAFFALAYWINHIHKNAWIAFQSWRASTKNASLTTEAESALLEAIEDQRHGDALYFWVRMDKDTRNPQNLDFWTFCDALNAGNCRAAVSKALQRMYGVRDDWNCLPQMPNDVGSWSVMHSWALPTRSFLEFVMFSRMFVDSMDMEMYDEHDQSKNCYLSMYEDSHCYARVLELLVNVWAYHSARRIVYVNPESGSMQEFHRQESRRGKMWIKWFSYETLKSMDEELAEEADSDHPSRRWLWPSTGEVVWMGTHKREMNSRQTQKEKRRQGNKETLGRIEKRVRQKTTGKHQ
ncbi:hypothetical protein Cni_G23465 [Canna indica]|uniref:Glycosyl transferase family 1 domain-containing protein n=1 Tax=Canna indica TaxID=4628 RepID=A0AAQ3QKH3_9LILI|nr:hypothetical protein Cni_G23465 [Canna indica]